ncbi:ribulose-phosphate 3-epimerase [bacterium BMS3Abin04]|nr:ribulose-phosphate 3-epimerase [bacterium BMS3Abin04]
MSKFLAPSILSADFSNLSGQLRYIEIAGADLIHCDIMDGQFVPNLTFGPLVVKAINKVTNLPLDIHLMIKNPDALIQDFVDAGAGYITVHQEEVTHLNRTLNNIKKLGAKAGVAINPATPIETLSEVLDIVDLVLIMSVNPGFGGQTFIHSSVDKIKKLNKLKMDSNLDFAIEVDGGINSKTIKEVSEAGCNIFVAGSSIFKADNITAAAAELKNLIS